jgi:hypothetical protein
VALRHPDPTRPTLAQCNYRVNPPRGCEEAFTARRTPTPQATAPEALHGGEECPVNSADWHLRYYEPERRSDLIRQAAKRDRATELLADCAA